MAEVLRVVGPPGAGKSLLITSLMEALRTRGYRTASAVQRDETTTVFTLSSGSRSVIERSVPATYLPGIATMLDPTVRVVFAEGYADAGVPAIEVRRPGDAPFALEEADRWAVADADELARAFAQGGPGDTIGLADRVQREIIGEAAQPEGNTREAEQTKERGFGIGRLLRRFR